MKVYAFQIDIRWENPTANFEKVSRLLTRAAPEKDSLIVLPEMFATGFSMNAVAEPEGGETEQYLAATAKEFRACLVAGVAIRERDGQARNEALVYSPSGDLLARYSKMRPFTPGGESRHYAAGERPVAFTWQGWIVAPFVCYDLRFPEIFRVATAEHRPHLFLIIANWPQKRIQHWIRLLQARAVENQAYVVGVNRCGSDPDHTYNGHSLIVDPHGEILSDANEGEGWIEGRLDLAGLEKYRTDLPFLADLRPARIGC